MGNSPESYFNLVYTDLSSVEIKAGRDGGLNVQNFNDALQAMISNDTHLVMDGGAGPGVFERSWWNNDSISGYAAGAAVWLNTESRSDFLNVRKQDIIKYVIGNQLADEYKAISSDPDL